MGNLLQLECPSVTRLVYQFVTSEAEKLKLMQNPKAASQWQKGSWIQNLDVKHLIPCRFYFFQNHAQKLRSSCATNVSNCRRMTGLVQRMCLARDVLVPQTHRPKVNLAGSSIRAGLAGLVCNILMIFIKYVCKNISKYIHIYIY